MKPLIIILLLLPIFCFSQSSTDCPTWDNKGKPKNKADYYRSLRSTKSVKRTDSSKTNYPTTKQKTIVKKVETAKPIVKKTEVKKDFTKTEVREKEEKEKKTKRLPPRKTTKAPKKKTTGCPQF